MAEAEPAIGIDALPDDALQAVLGHLSLPERLRLSTVCRRWQAVVLSPPLLAQVAIEAGTGNDIDMLRVATSWLMRRAAGSVQQLSVDLQHAEFDPDCEEREEAVVLITATLAALGARGTLRQVSMQLGSFTMLPLGAWAAALSGLQQLSIAGKEGRISVSGDLRGLTALQSLELEDEDVQLAASTQLPPSLTHFKLSSSSYVGDSSGLAPQVASLTHLRSLCLGNFTYRGQQYGPLAALSSTLQSLTMDNCDALPSCLPEMLALRTLIVMAKSHERWFIPDQTHNYGTLYASLKQLPGLECLAVDMPTLLPELALVPGPWQRTLRQLAGPARMLEASLPALSEASSLQELAIGEPGKQAQQAAVLSGLRWAAGQRALPLRRLVLLLPADKITTLEMLEACLELKGRHPHLKIQPATRTSVIPLHSFLSK